MVESNQHCRIYIFTAPPRIQQELSAHYVSRGHHEDNLIMYAYMQVDDLETRSLFDLSPPSRRGDCILIGCSVINVSDETGQSDPQACILNRANTSKSLVWMDRRQQDGG